MTEKQKTLKKPVSINGSGLHTGRNVHMIIKPALENHGIRFRRTDVEGQPEINASADLVVDTSRGTSIEDKGIRIRTVEHILAALTGLGIDNALIELDCSETPILDGSSRIFTEEMFKAGVQIQNEERKAFVLTKEISYRDPENKVEIIAVPSDEYRLSVFIDFETKVLGTQNAELNSIADFKDEIAPCRTFVFLHELEYLLNNNLIKGGDLSNAIVFVNRIISQEELNKLSALFNKPKVKVLNEGILNNIELNFTNEPARHKLLDVIGDLTLIGQPIKAHIIAKRPGHTANVEFAKIIKEHIKEMNTNPIAHVNVNKPPVYDIKEIMKILPHRPPFLLIDKVLEISDSHVIGLKNVTMNEPFFIGHYPDLPVMPGVLQVEAMAQTGGILILSNLTNPKLYDPLFMKIENVKFRNRVVPGDTLLFRMELLSPIRRGICHMKGEAFANNTLVTEAELLAKIVKKTEY